MFGLGIFTYLKLGLALVAVLVLSFLVWNYHHMKVVIAEQKIEIGNLQLGQKILEDKAQVVDEFMAKQSKIRKRVAQDEQAIDESVNSGDADRVIKQFDPYRMQPGGKIQPPANGGKGRPGPPVSRPPNPGSH